MTNFMSKANSINQVFADAFKLYKSSILKVWYWSLLPALVNILSKFYPPLVHMEGDVAEQTLRTIHVSWLGVIIFLITIIFSIFCYSMVFCYLNALITEEKKPLMSAMYKSFSKLPRTLLATLIFYLLIFFCMILMIIGYSLVGVTSAIVFALIIFISIAIIMYLPLILFDNESAINALNKSRNLIWGHWWRTLILLLIPGLIALLCSIIVVLIFGVDNIKAQAISTSVIYTLLLPLVIALLLRQFYNLKAIKRIPKVPLLRIKY